jgi:hypothetical protein
MALELVSPKTKTGRERAQNDKRLKKRASFYQEGYITKAL